MSERNEAIAEPEKVIVVGGVNKRAYEADDFAVDVRIDGEHLVIGVLSERMGDLSNGDPYFSHYSNIPLRIIPMPKTRWKRVWEALI